MKILVFSEGVLVPWTSRAYLLFLRFRFSFMFFYWVCLFMLLCQLFLVGSQGGVFLCFVFFFLLLFQYKNLNISTLSVGTRLGRHCCCLVASHVPLFGIPWTISLKTPLSMGFPRKEYWSGLPFPSPRNIPDPKIKPTPPWEEEF